MGPERNVYNSPIEGAMQLKQAPLYFSFRFLLVAYFSQNVFWTRQKKTPDYRKPPNTAPENNNSKLAWR